MFLYEGGQNLTPTYPTKLKKYDVVITTYNVLQNELRLSENGQVVFNFIFTLKNQAYFILICKGDIVEAST